MFSQVSVILFRLGGYAWSKVLLCVGMSKRLGWGKGMFKGVGIPEGVGVPEGRGWGGYVYPSPPTWELGRTITRIVGKQAVHMLLECFLLNCLFSKRNS